MPDSDSVYKPPSSDVVVKQELPQEYENGQLTHVKLRTLAWISIVNVVIVTVIVALSILNGFGLEEKSYENLYHALMIVSMIIWAYIMIMFKSFLNLRFNYTKTNSLIYILIALSVIMTIVSLFMSETSSYRETATIAYIVLLVPTGIVTILFGIRLLKLSDEFRYVNSFAWINIVYGVCTTSIVLLVVAVPLALVSDFFVALIFFEAARERSPRRL